MLQGLAYDEAFDDAGAPREGYDEPLAVLARLGRDAVVDHQGIAIGGGGDARPLPLDPVPRVLTAAEWGPLSAGLAQRARALDAWVADAYGARRAVREGIVPARLLETSVYFEPDLPPMDTGLGVIGFDVVRGEDGAFAVLEDNVLTPGHAAVPAAREVLTLWRHVARPPVDVRSPTRRLLGGLLDGGRGAILADDDGPGAAWELRWLARFLGVPLTTGADGFDVLWQRTSEDRLSGDDGVPNALGRALLPRLRAGTLRIVSRPGCGVASDKGLAPHVPDLVRRFCGEEPLLDQVPAATLADALDDPAGHVFKPRNGAGARGVTIGEVPAGLDPGGWIAQRRVSLSVHPTLVNGELEARPVDLRVFAIRTEDGAFEVLPGGVSRFAPATDAEIVNTSAGGGIKDVWVLSGP
jgi:carboxylate-amine ligase